MSRNVKIPFNREMSISSSSYVGEEEGFFVPDILSLTIDITSSKLADIILEGKIGSSGDWQNLATAKGVGRLSKINISEFSHVRVYVVTSTSINVNLFGYHAQETSQQEVKLIDKDSDNVFMSRVLLEDILKEIQTMNDKLNILNEEEL